MEHQASRIKGNAFTGCLICILAVLISWTISVQLEIIQLSKKFENIDTLYRNAQLINDLALRKRRNIPPCHCKTALNRDNDVRTTQLHDVSSSRQPGPAGPPGRFTPTQGQDGRPGGSEPTKQVTYVRWGKHTCTGFESSVVWKGFAFGFNDPHLAANGLQCIEDKEMELAETQSVSVNGPNLSAIQLNLMNVRPKSAIGPWDAANLKRIPCAVCLITASDTIIQYGSRSCKADWSTLYNGYSIASNGDPTSPICLDEIPESIGSDVTGSKTPKVGFGMQDGKIVTCVVCARAI